MFHQLIMNNLKAGGNEGMTEINKNIQKLKKEYGMSVADAVTFVKKKYPQFSHTCNCFETHFESSETTFEPDLGQAHRQKNFQKTEPLHTHSVMNYFLAFLMALLLLAKITKTISNNNSSNNNSILNTENFERQSLNLVAATFETKDLTKLQQMIENFKKLETKIKNKEEFIKDDLTIEVNSIDDDIIEEQEILYNKRSNPNTQKISQLTVDKAKAERLLNIAEQKLNKMKQKLQTMKNEIQKETQAVRDAENGNNEFEKQMLRQIEEKTKTANNDDKEKKINDTIARVRMENGE
jgi:hypothetical protein